LGRGGLRSFHPPGQTAATTTQAPSVGGCHPRAERPEPARRLQGAVNEIRQTYSSRSWLIATQPTTPGLPNARTRRERRLLLNGRLSFSACKDPTQRPGGKPHLYRSSGGPKYVASALRATHRPGAATSSAPQILFLIFLLIELTEVRHEMVVKPPKSFKISLGSRKVCTTF
jgi:hypothetical protein